MAAGSSTQQTFRRAIGALKDSTKVGLAKVNSENKGIDVAIVKATNHDEVLAKEKHIKTIFIALSASSHRADVHYCIHGLTRRLAKTHSWTVALKTLVVIHRALKEVDDTFREALINYSRGSRLMLNLSHFRDDSSPNAIQFKVLGINKGEVFWCEAWDYSAWVRAYALYLEEQLECLCVLKYDIQKNPSRMKDIDTPHLLEQLPAMQQLLFRLLACKPEGMALHNSLIHYALSIVAGESVKLYVAITDGIVNMVDKYFEMERHDAIRALDIYKKAASQGEKLSEFFEICWGIGFGRRLKSIKIQKPPTSFLTAMEEYVADAPHVLALEWIHIDDKSASPKEVPSLQSVTLVDYKQVIVEKKADQCATSSDPSKSNKNEAAPTAPVTDLLCLDDFTQEASELDDNNSLALAIVTSDNPLNCESSINSTSQTTDWELALVTATSCNGAAVVESKLAGGLDKLTLDRLYDDAMARGTNQNSAYQTGQMAPNPFESFHNNQDSFCASSNIPLSTNEPTVAISQEQIFLMQQEQKQKRQQQQPPVTGFNSTNPFGNPFVDDNVPSFV